jgi:multicomponent Na+:H+ antiporter subunit D
MHMLPPLLLAVPLIGAAVLVASGFLLGRFRRAVDLLGIAIAGAELLMAVLLMLHVGGGETVYWFGGWKPESGGVAIGIDFAVDELSATLAALVSLLVLASLVFSWRYVDAVGTLYHALMLAFLGGMVGFSLSGDLFNLFVFFELMGVAAYALTAYRSEEAGPLQGALNFAVSNSSGAFLALLGIGLLYGRTGALNMAQVGAAIAGHGAGGLVVVALVLIVVGLLVKAAVVPFHFWLADAHAVAPTPVCVLFSGVMVELGIYAVARVYWAVFDGAMAPYRGSVRAALLAVGVLTVIVGAAMCVRQHHVKRLLAFSTIAHSGMLLCGVALLTPLGLAGVALFVLGHGLVKGALFLCTGVLLHREGSVDEADLHGRGRELPVTGVLFTAGGLALAGLPPFTLSLGKGLLEDSATANGFAWLLAVVIAGSVVTASAVLRVAGSVFLGIGPRPHDESPADQEGHREGSETDAGQGQPRGRTPVVMVAPIVVLLGVALAAGLWSSIGAHAQDGAMRMQDRAGYAGAVLGGTVPAQPHTVFPPEPSDRTVASVATGAASALAALGFALLSLQWHRVPETVRRAVASTSGVMRALRRTQSGHVGDYVAWIAAGTAALGGILALSTR